MKGYSRRITWFLTGIWIATCVIVTFPELSSGQSSVETVFTEETKPRRNTTSLFRKAGGITGDSFEFDNTQKTMMYTGNVKVVQDETSMFSDKLVIYLAKIGGQVEKAVATGNVRLLYGDITATGEKGIFYNDEQKLELEKNAKMWQGKNTITAHRILAFLQEEIIEGYGDPSSERVIMTAYSQGDIPDPGQSPEQDSSPIVIESDTLKYDSAIQKAVYTGNVIATKDVTEIKADEMVVYLAQTSEAENDIEKIEVFGNVQIVQENTTITGDKGVYFNEEQRAQIEGTDAKKARAEDKVQHMILKAPIIELFLETNTIKARGGKVETFFDEESEFTEESESTPEKKTKKNREGFPSVTLYPKKK